MTNLFSFDNQAFFREKLANLEKGNLYRKPKNNNQKKLINFCSNDYLNLSQNKAVKNAAIKAIKQYGVGSTASRYVLDNSGLADKLEKKLAKFKNCQSAFVIGSGYLSGFGVISALVGKDDLIIADKLIHSSLIDGAKLSKATLMRFKHNDIEHCKQILLKQIASNNFKKCLIISETVFSMDGDLGKIEQLIQIAQKYQCLLISDDAHGLGIIQHQYSNYDFHLQLGTFSKAVGGYGGYVCGSNFMIEYLRNFTKTAIYSTQLPPAILAANLKALEIIAQNENKANLQNKALLNANYFYQIISKKIINQPISVSAIVPIIIGDAKKTLLIAKKIEKQGFLVSAIRPPTVENGKSRLRIAFRSNHKKKDIKKLADLILKFCL